MTAIWNSLVWKEWHEHKWKLAAIVTILWAPTVALAYFIDGDPELLLIGMLFSLVPLSIFVGLGTAAGERSRGTLPFLQSLPLPMRSVALCKIGFGVATVIIPVLLTLGLVLIWSLIREWLAIEPSRLLQWLWSDGKIAVTGNTFVDIALVTGSAALSFYIWSAALGANRKDEVSAGAVVLAGMVGWWLLLFVGWNRLLESSTAPELAKIRAIAFGSAPAGVVGVLDHNWPPPDARWLGILSAIATHLFLIAWYLRRYGQVTENPHSPRPQAADVGSFEMKFTPMSGPLRAIAWKQFRESGPLVLLGLAGIIGTSLLLLGVVVTTNDNVIIRWQDFLGSFVIGTYIFGFIIALVVGIGVCLYEVSPKISTFWRSRPIQPDMWFWTKFVTGAVMLMAALFPPVVIAYALLPNGSDFIDDELFFLPVAHLTTFAAAVAMTCLVRHAVYAAILTIPAVYAGIYLVFAGLKAAEQFGWLQPATDGRGEFPQTAIAAGFVVSFVLNTVLAWLAFRYDWGRKGRY